MNQRQQAKAAKKFIENWIGHGYEKGETQKFWIDLLTTVFGVENIAQFIFFEEQVKDTIQNKTVTNFIDAYIPSTRVMIEQKSSYKNLREPIKQSDGSLLTPFQQAKKYVADLPLSLHPKWVVTCNFDEFLIYDMENPNSEPQQVFLKDLQKDFYRLQFLADTKTENIKREEEISLKAGILVGKLYNALYKEYIAPDEKSLRSLNILCVRIVFCLYAEDAGIFATKTSFEDYIKSFNLPHLRKAIIELFKGLDTNIEDRDKYDESLKPFPYVNGGLFKDKQIEIPNFTEEIVDVIVNHCAPFNWSEISPTIFGAVFESTLNPETRRKGGMHYTSIANIHKVIDPLFMDGLKLEFTNIMGIDPDEINFDKAYAAMSQKQKKEIQVFQEKLSTLTFLDPACGSGNFLTESYLSLRRLENCCIRLLSGGQTLMGNLYDPIQVTIKQFHGIEINDFAVTVAKTALWIAECQMMKETEKIVNKDIDFLPLTTNAFIMEGNALLMDWSTLKLSRENSQPTDGLFSGFTTETDGTVHHYDYIMGNPPFVGKKEQSKMQKEELVSLFPKTLKGVGNLDYVSGWYAKAIALIKDTQTKCAFVSTNSITQGEQVPTLWKYLSEQGLSIDFAWRTFRWDSESTEKAHVHCVIIGFSHKNSIQKQKYIFDEGGNRKEAKQINGYMIDAADVFIENRAKPLCPVPEIVYGSMPIDDGHLILTKEEAEEIICENKANAQFVRKYVGGDELLNRGERFCLWLRDASPKELRSSKLISAHIKATEIFRKSSTRPQTLKLAETPWLFGEIRQPEKVMLAIPKVSSERRRYIPMVFVEPETIVNGSTLIIPNAALYEFGILMSNVHNAWMRVVAGRLETRYQYSNTVVYNNFPWCNPTVEQKAKIEKSAQSILDARKKFSDSSLADLYDESFMPAELRKAHRENDTAVMQAYGFNIKMTESECVAELFKLYEKLSKGE